MDPNENPSWHWWHWFSPKTKERENDNRNIPNSVTSGSQPERLDAVTNTEKEDKDEDPQQNQKPSESAKTTKTPSTSSSSDSSGSPPKKYVPAQTDPQQNQEPSDPAKTTKTPSTSSSSGSSGSPPRKSVPAQTDPTLQTVPQMSLHIPHSLLKNSNPRVSKVTKVPPVTRPVHPPKLSAVQASASRKRKRTTGHSKAKTNKLLHPRDKTNMAKVLPVDDNDYLGGWVSRVIIESISSLFSGIPTQKLPSVAYDSSPSSDSLKEGAIADVEAGSKLQLDVKSQEELEVLVTKADMLFADESFQDEIFLDVDAYKNDALYAPYGFLVLCSFQILWGVFALIQVIILRALKNDAEEFFGFDKKFNRRPLYLLICAAVQAIVIGALGFAALLKDLPAIYVFIYNTEWLICASCLGSVIIAYGGWSTPTEATYFRILEAVKLHRDNPEYLNTAFPSLKPDFFDQMHRSIRCCGLKDASDWIKHPHPQMPMSCCVENVEKCNRTISSWMNKMTTAQDFETNFEDIRPLLYTDNCIDAISKERDNLKRDWWSYPAIYLAFYFVMMINFNYLLHVIQREYYSWEGISRMYTFRVTDTKVYKARLKDAFCTVFPCCGGQKKVSPTAENPSSKHLGQSRHSRGSHQNNRRPIKNAEDNQELDKHNSEERLKRQNEDELNVAPHENNMTNLNEGERDRNRSQLKGEWKYKARSADPLM